MLTSEQCRAKAEDLEREARTSKSAVRRDAFLDLADQWRRLADAQNRAPRKETTETLDFWRRREQVN